MSPTMRRAGLTAALVVVIGVATVGVAPGHEKTYKLKPKPTIHYTNDDARVGDPVDFFSGDLIYKKRVTGGQHCLDDRTVRVFRLGSPIVKIGETQTADDGTWKLEAEDVADGDYRATALKKFVKVTIPPGPGIGGHIHKFRCLPARSGEIHAGP